MPSSLFSSPKRFYKRPVICKASPLGYPLLDDPFLPPGILAAVRSADIDPPIDFDFTTHFELYKHPEKAYYAGSSAQAPQMHILHVTRLTPEGDWKIVLTERAPFSAGWQFVFYVFIKPEKHAWNCPRIQQTSIPGKDIQAILLKA